MHKIILIHFHAVGNKSIDILFTITLEVLLVFIMNFSTEPLVHHRSNNSPPMGPTYLDKSIQFCPQNLRFVLILSYPCHNLEIF